MIITKNFSHRKLLIIHESTTIAGGFGTWNSKLGTWIPIGFPSWALDSNWISKFGTPRRGGANLEIQWESNCQTWKSNGNPTAKLGNPIGFRLDLNVALGFRLDLNLAPGLARWISLGFEPGVWISSFGIWSGTWISIGFPSWAFGFQLDFQVWHLAWLCAI